MALQCILIEEFVIHFRRWFSKFDLWVLVRKQVTRASKLKHENNSTRSAERNSLDNIHCVIAARCYISLDFRKK